MLCWYNSIAPFASGGFIRGFPGFLGQFSVKNKLFIYTQEWQLIQRYIYKEDSSGNGTFFNRTLMTNTGLQNENDPNNNIYSILGKNCNNYYQDNNGKYTFKLIWYQKGGQYVLIWKQTTCPQTSSTIVGYEPISIPEQIVSDSCALFKGLGLSNWAGYTYLDGNGDEGCWWNAIAPYKPFLFSYPAFLAEMAASNELYVLTQPTLEPTTSPTNNPTNNPSNNPTNNPTTFTPTMISITDNPSTSTTMTQSDNATLSPSLETGL